MNNKTTSSLSFSEGLVTVEVPAGHSQPGTSEGFFNPVMRVNRDLSLATLHTLLLSSASSLQYPLSSSSSSSSSTTPIAAVNGFGITAEGEGKALRCLDAFSASGVLALRWAKELDPRKVGEGENPGTLLPGLQICANDLEASCTKLIRESEEKNGLSGTLDVQQMSASVIMLQRTFEYIHLDPYGSCVPFIDSAVANLPNKGILTLTSTDTSTLYCHYPHVAQRHYGVAGAARTEYFREIGARMVVTMIIQAAARRDKGIRVLCCVSAEHFVWVAVQVLRGARHSDTSISQMGYIHHCVGCGHRTATGSACECPGEKQSMRIGPIYMGDLFDHPFVSAMKNSSSLELHKKTRKILEAIWFESTVEDTGARRLGYFVYHNYCQQAGNPPKMEDLLNALRSAGFQASKTHFDAKGIRTNATASQLRHVIRALVSE